MYIQYNLRSKEEHALEKTGRKYTRCDSEFKVLRNKTGKGHRAELVSETITCGRPSPFAVGVLLGCKQPVRRKVGPGLSARLERALQCPWQDPKWRAFSCCPVQLLGLRLKRGM